MDPDVGVKLEDLKSRCDQMKTAIEETVSQFGDMEGKSQCEKGLYSAALATMNWLVIFSNTLMMTMKTSNDTMQAARKSAENCEKAEVENAGGESSNNKLKNDSNINNNSKTRVRRLSKSRTLSDMETTRKSSQKRQTSSGSIKSPSKIQPEIGSLNPCLCHPKRPSKISSGDDKENTSSRKSSKDQEKSAGVSSKKRKSSGKKK